MRREKHPPLSLCQQDMINCVGGMHVLFPLLEQLALAPPSDQEGGGGGGGGDGDYISPDVATPAEGDWVILPSNRASGESPASSRPARPGRRRVANDC